MLAAAPAVAPPAPAYSLLGGPVLQPQPMMPALPQHPTPGAAITAGGLPGTTALQPGVNSLTATPGGQLSL
eukprot:15421251-Alexandrium_andersonii.AAC.1